MSHGGKGDTPRPFSVSQREYETRWDAIFRRDGLDEEKRKDPEPESKSSKVDNTANE